MTSTYQPPILGAGPTWVCPKEGCQMIRTTACKPAGCANDRIDGREFKSQVLGYIVDDELDVAAGWADE